MIFVFMLSVTVNISQTDGTSHGCQCKNCRAVEAEEGSPSGPWIRIYDTEGNCTPAYMDKLADIWEQIYALDTLTGTQKYHVDCAAVQFYDIATSVYNTIAGKTRDSEVRQKVRDYKAKLRDAKERTGL